MGSIWYQPSSQSTILRISMPSEVVPRRNLSSVSTIFGNASDNDCKGASSRAGGFFEHRPGDLNVDSPVESLSDEIDFTSTQTADMHVVPASAQLVRDDVLQLESVVL